jgi:endonuclease/exonuclease/phosphatase family metal-dependent hydrolase
MSEDAAEPKALRFVTLNLWGDNGPHERRLELVALELERLAPDVVALQEVRDVPGKVPNQAATLGARLAMRHVFAPSTAWGGGHEGLAVLVRAEVLDSAQHDLPHSEPKEGRIVLSVKVGGPRRPYWVHTTHLSFRHNEGLKREEQVQAIDQVVTARAADADEPQILMGDFNTTPDADELRWLRGLTTLGGRRVYYQDAWEVIRPGDPGITWASENPFRARLDWLRADRRLDYVFVTAERRDGRGRVHEVRRVFDRPDTDGVYPSDHYGVLADIQMTPDLPPPEGA